MARFETAVPGLAQQANNIADMSAREIVRRIAKQELSSVAVVEHFIARLNAVGAKLNAVTVDLFDSARTTASSVDQALARGKQLGPLAGLPVTIKECFDLAGTASTFGLPSRQHLIETKDDPYVFALRASGAIPIAKTNVPELMIFTETDNPLYGRTNNPWNLERSCGGSSGGEAAVIAAGASPLGLGNDIGGSLRIPAAFCGIASMKPTAGRLSDHCSHGLPTGQRGIPAQAGPMAKHVDDLVMMLEVLDSARDPYIQPGLELGDPNAVDFSRLRFAILMEDGEFPVTPAARRAVSEAARYLRSAGAASVPWKNSSLHRVNDLFFACLSADRAQALKRLLRGNAVDKRIRPLLRMAGMPSWLRGIVGSGLDAVGHHRAAMTLRRFASGTVDQYWQTVDAIEDFKRDLLQSLEKADGGPIDVLLCPAYPLPAVRHGATEFLPIPGAYTTLANVSGFPAGIVPVTRVRSGEESDRPVNRDPIDRLARDNEIGSIGLPIGVQVISRPWRDHIALAAMSAIEAAARQQADYPAQPPI
jgi:fatty acid amide hydrolase